VNRVCRFIRHLFDAKAFPLAPSCSVSSSKSQQSKTHASNLSYGTEKREKAQIAIEQGKNKKTEPNQIATEGNQVQLSGLLGTSHTIFL